MGMAKPLTQAVAFMVTNSDIVIIIIIIIISIYIINRLR